MKLHKCTHLKKVKQIQSYSVQVCVYVCVCVGIFVPWQKCVLISPGQSQPNPPVRSNAMLVLRREKEIPATTVSDPQHDSTAFRNVIMLACQVFMCKGFPSCGGELAWLTIMC